MFTKLTKKFGFTFGCLAAVIMVLLICAISWIVTCGVIYLITLCFGWTFSWAIATGVWLVMCLLRTVFKNNVTVKD